MKSSAGKYFIGLDHVRAVAVFVLFTWHFIHVTSGHQAPPPTFPLFLLSEGHTGVALFMTLSGYLFAKLLGDKKIIYTSFIWNRFLRIAPLMLIVITIIGFREYLTDGDVVLYAKSILAGIIKPTLPNGGWSITVEFHFYLVLPVLLFLTRKWKYSLVFVLIAAVFARALLFHESGEIQSLSYWTIIGRIDQFLLGILAYRFRQNISGRHFLMLCSTIMFFVFYWYFDSKGGFYLSESYPSPSSIWIYLPTMEGAAYALAISWYDNSFEHSTGKLSRLIALVGTYSYSIYLLHFFVVFRLADRVNTHIADLTDIRMAILFSFLSFWVMVPIGYVSFTFIESPFLRFRTRYIVEDNSENVTPPIKTAS